MHRAIIGPCPDKGLITLDMSSGKELRLVSSDSLAVNNRNVAMDLALQGIGMTRLIKASALDPLADGRLVRVFPDHDLKPLYRSMSVVTRFLLRLRKRLSLYSIRIATNGNPDLGRAFLPGHADAGQMGATVYGAAPHPPEGM